MSGCCVFVACVEEVGLRITSIGPEELDAQMCNSEKCSRHLVWIVPGKVSNAARCPIDVGIAQLVRIFLWMTELGHSFIYCNFGGSFARESHVLGPRLWMYMVSELSRSK